MTYAVEFTKGHGTGNDFVFIDDPTGALEVPAEAVRAVCDRRFGVGGDGLIRVVRSAAAGVDSAAEWFMDYRNADGSVAEMCGNGVRVFARYLLQAGLVSSGTFAVATRGGDMAISAGEADITVRMGRPSLPAGAPVVSVDGRSFTAVPVFMPNPHAVVLIDDLEQVGPLLQAPHVDDPVFPHGANVEFVQRLDRGHVRLRVHERGVGETLSCGTGVCAVAVVVAGSADSWSPVIVDVPGGRLTVSFPGGGPAGGAPEVALTGPAELVASGRLNERLSEALRG